MIWKRRLLPPVDSTPGGWRGMLRHRQVGTTVVGLRGPFQRGMRRYREFLGRTAPRASLYFPFAGSFVVRAGFPFGRDDRLSLTWGETKAVTASMAGRSVEASHVGRDGEALNR